MFQGKAYQLIRVSPLRAELSPLGIHQNPETSSSITATEECEVNSVHGRHTTTRGVERYACRSPHQDSAPLREFGGYNKLEEISLTVHKVLRPHGRLPSDGATFTSYKNNKRRLKN